MSEQSKPLTYPDKPALMIVEEKLDETERNSLANSLYVDSLNSKEEQKKSGLTSP